jgi:hypothetical protein
MSCILRHQGSHNLLDGSKPLRLGTWPAFLEIRERVPWMSRVTYSPDSRRFGHSGIHSLTTAVKPLKPPFVINTLTTASPCVGRPLTVTAPMPGEPPVTSATVRTNFSVMFILIYLHNHLLLPGGFAPFCVPCVAMLRRLRRCTRSFALRHQAPHRVNFLRERGRVGNFFLEGPATSAADQRHSLSRSALEVVIEARVDGDAANRLLPRYR